VVYESTVYPGCTEEDCIPVLEETSGLTFGKDFTVGYSPERINPGDKQHTLTNTIKVVSGSDKATLDLVASVYELVVEAGVHRAPCIKVAEAAKIIENTQRDINIGLMNELSIIFGRLGINTYDVLEAAGTKWNFLKFYPGLVGGHCIGVDPYYLVHKAKELNYHPQIIGSGRFVNDSMGRYIAKQTVKRLIKMKKNLSECRILVLGITFKENVSDIRNSKVAETIDELMDYGLEVVVADPWADSKEVKEEYGFELNEALKVENLKFKKSALHRSAGKSFDAIILAVAHREYVCLTEEDLLPLAKPNALLVDVKGNLRGKVKKMAYWSL